jgi:hypothetical protein
MHLDETGCMGVWWINSPRDMNEWWGCCEHGNEHLGSKKCREFLPGNVNFSVMALRHSISYVIRPTWLRSRISPSWEASSRPATQQIPLLLYNHNPLLVPILSHLCPIYKLPRYNVYFNITLPSTLRSSKWALSFSFHNQDHLHLSRDPYVCYKSYSNSSSLI